MPKEINMDSNEFKLAAFEVYQQIRAKHRLIESKHKDVKDMSRAFLDFKKETLKEIAELDAQIASGVIQGNLI